MKSQKLFNWLNRLSGDELSEFQSYIQLHSLGASRMEIEVVDALIELKDADLEKHLVEAIKLRVWPGTEIKESYWNKVCSSLMKYLREYLAWKSWRKKRHSVPLDLVRYANENHWDEAFLKIYNQGWKVLETEQDSTYYRRKAEFLNEKAIYDYRISRQPNPAPIVSVMKELDTAYRLEKIKFAASVRNHEAVFRKSFGLEEIADLVTAIEEQYNDFPLVGKLYFHAYQSMDAANGERHFVRLRALVNDNSNEVSPDDTWDLNTYLINFCARQIRDGKEGYRQELKSLFEMMLQRGVFLERGKISPWLYKNIIVSTLRLGQLDWVTEFSEMYEASLHNDYQGNAAQFCRGAIAFSKGDYTTARSCLATVLQEYQDHFYGVEGRLLYWRCNVEMEEVIPMTYQSDAYIKFFRRHPLLNADYKASVIGFLRLSLRYVDALCLANKERRRAMLKIMRRIDKMEPLDLLEWLRNKIVPMVK